MEETKRQFQQRTRRRRFRRRIARKPSDFLICSDFHLASGWNPETGRLAHNEDFFFDEEFSRFLEHFENESATSGRKWKLVLNGDVVDFLQVLPEEGELEKLDFPLAASEKQYGPGTSPEKTVWKMEKILRGHPRFFEALRRFASKGHEVIIIKGNHDVEFHWEEVQRAFRKGVGVPERVRFYPWFYYEKGLIYIEHGNQYVKTDCFESFLNPVLPPLPDYPDEHLIDLPLGSFFVRYLFNYIEQRYPFSDNIKPVSKFMLWMFLYHFFDGLGLLRRYVPFVLRTLRKMRSLPPEKVNAIRAEHLERVRQLERRLGLEGKLVTLDALKEAPRKTKMEVFWEMIQGPILTLLGAAGAGFLVVLGLCYLFVTILDAPTLSRSLKALYLTLMVLGIVVGYVLLIVAVTRAFNTSLWEASELREAARRIGELFDVKIITFGHTHEVDYWKIPGKNCEYFNTGTWVPVFSEEEQLLREAKQFTFLKVVGGKGELLRWNDARGEPEKVLLM